MRATDQFTGAWILESWQYEKDGKRTSYPFGKDAEGLLIYSLEGMMSAILMEPGRKPGSTEGYISYGGTYVIRSGQVSHTVMQSLDPGWIGQVLVREYAFEEYDQRLILSTLPERNSKGQMVRNILSWKRHD